MTDLQGKVALVAGATRGAGRGIAVALGEAGATVYCTGRTTRSSSPSTSDRRRSRRRPSCRRGRRHRHRRRRSTTSRPTRSRALVARIDREQGRLDVLVNDIWGGEQLVDWNTPVWEHDLDRGLRLLRLAIDTHLITSHHALPLLIRRPGGLRGRGHRRHRRVQRRQLPALDLLRPGQDGSIIRLAWSPGPRAGRARLHRGGAHAGLAALGDDARDLRGQRGELARRRARSHARTSRISETPRFVGRAVAALAADPDVARWNGESLSPASSPRSTASPTSTAPGPTPGATWSRSRTPACRPTTPATADSRPASQSLARPEASSASARL